MISKWAIFVLLAVISAHPFSKNFGDRVRRALVENGTNYNETAKSVTSKRHGDATWTSCGVESDLGKIKTVSITPNPPKKGQVLNLEATVELSEEVQAGSLQVTIKLIIYGIEITVATDSYDLCGPEIGLKCPLKAGIVKINFKEEVHSSIPSGMYTGHIVATRSQGDRLLCFNLEFSL